MSLILCSSKRFSFIIKLTIKIVSNSFLDSCVLKKSIALGVFVEVVGVVVIVVVVVVIFVVIIAEVAVVTQKSALTTNEEPSP